MPEGLRYCGECEMFTVRKRGHRGVCEFSDSHSHSQPSSDVMGRLLCKANSKEGYHGKPKPRSYKGNFWTHKSRKGAFGSEIWKMWVNNAAMDRFEGRLRRGVGAERRGKGRYGLRELGASGVDTRGTRESMSRQSGWGR